MFSYVNSSEFEKVLNQDNSVMVLGAQLAGPQIRGLVYECYYLLLVSWISKFSCASSVIVSFISVQYLHSNS